MAITLLHLSDIHFKHYINDTAVFDLDNDVRSSLERDLTSLIPQHGKIDAVLIGGDIAFSGTPEEYAVADQWIAKICSIVHCDKEYVFPVPGNHDIHRSSISEIVSEIQQKVKTLTKRNDIDTTLEKYLKDSRMMATIIAPLTNYDSFAQKYGGSLSENRSLYWEKELNDGQNLIVKIKGINSALFSNNHDHPTTSPLIIGTAQCTIGPEENKLNVILCHHPPSWLADGAQIQHDMCERASLLLFGHVHTLEIQRIDDTIMVSAGALQPERNDLNWIPSYNIINLSLPSSAAAHHVSITIWKRVWDRQQMRFVSGSSGQPSPSVSYTVPLKYPDQLPVEMIAAGDTLIQEAMAETPEIVRTNSPDPMRALAFRFLALPYHIKVRIAANLNLIQESDRDLSDGERNIAYFERVRTAGKSKDLWDQINAETGESDPNPF